MCAGTCVSVSCAFSFVDLFHLIPVCLSILLLFLVPVCVLARERKGVDLGGTGTGEDPRGAGGGETIAR